MKNDGPAGLVTGLGRGVIGTVVKPVTGNFIFGPLLLTFQFKPIRIGMLQMLILFFSVTSIII